LIPKLRKSARKLGYIRETAKEFGGRFFYMGTNERCIYHATFKSPTRRKLFQEGSNLPTNYLLIVPGEKLIHLLVERGALLFYAVKCEIKK